VERVSLEVANEVAKTVSGVARDIKPGVAFGSLTDLGVRFSIDFQVKEYNDQWRVKHELIKRLQTRFEQEGIQFASLCVLPQRDPRT
jgi:small-conductance mechanosensitive channel